MNEEIVMHLSSAADRWERAHPIIGFGELRVHDALRDAVRYIKETSAQVPRWISVEERLPENEERVLITEWHDGFYGKPWCVVMTAFHTDGNTYAENSDYNWTEGSVEMRYDEEADDFIVPEGWWEDVQCGDEFSQVDAKVTHWMPLPEPPKEGA